MMIYDDDIYGVFLHSEWLAVSSDLGAFVGRCCWSVTAHCRTPNTRGAQQSTLRQGVSRLFCRP
jgi:hypothetical protein